MNEAVKIIREEIEKRGIKVIKIILFGSRAKGTYKEDSDWDFFVIIDKVLPFKEKREILGSIYKKLAQNIDESFEILIVSEKEFEESKKYIGTLSYEVDKEGVLLWH
ncbi:MAG: nucleotidyltransferase domain-containing protein [Caldimicrobium sp.]|jgi:predicted nucleotidyltransferase